MNYPGFVGYLPWNINITLAAPSAVASLHFSLSLHPSARRGRANQTAPAQKYAQNLAAWLLLTTQRTGVTHIYGLDFKPISVHFIYEPFTCFILTVPPRCSPQSSGHKLLTVGCGADYLVCRQRAPHKLMNYGQFIHWILSPAKSTPKKEPPLTRHSLQLQTWKWGGNCNRFYITLMPEISSLFRNPNAQSLLWICLFEIFFFFFFPKVLVSGRWLSKELVFPSCTARERWMGQEGRKGMENKNPKHKNLEKLKTCKNDPRCRWACGCLCIHISVYIIPRWWF